MRRRAAALVALPVLSMMTAPGPDRPQIEPPHVTVAASPPEPNDRELLLRASRYRRPAPKVVHRLPKRHAVSRRPVHRHVHTHVVHLTTSDGLNWAALRQCENSGSYRSSPGDYYRGAYQFDYGTWATVGGHGDPAAASPAEQDLRARLLYAERGRSPWPVCGHLL